MGELTDKAKALAQLAKQHKLRTTLDRLARQDLAKRLDPAPGK